MLALAYQTSSVLRRAHLALSKASKASGQRAQSIERATGTYGGKGGCDAWSTSQTWLVSTLLDLHLRFFVCPRNSFVGLVQGNWKLFTKRPLLNGPTSSPLLRRPHRRPRSGPLHPSCTTAQLHSASWRGGIDLKHVLLKLGPLSLQPLVNLKPRSRVYKRDAGRVQERAADRVQKEALAV